MIQEKDVTVIIPHLGTTEEQRRSLKECLSSLLETTADCQIIVATNGQKIDGYKWNDLNPIYNRVKRIHVEEQGQCRAVNAAVATVNTPWIFVTNDDMIYAPSWWDNLCKIGDGPFVSPDMMEGSSCISPKLIEPNDGAPTFQKYFCGGAGGDFDKAKWLEFAKNYRGEGLRTGFNLPFLIKKELWDLIGGYDINFDPWGSNGDSDLEYKIKLAGVQTYQHTNCIVYHFSQTSGTFHPDNRSYWDKNWHYFIEKWGFERASSPDIWTATFEIPEALLKYTPHWKDHYLKQPTTFRGMTIGETYGE